MEKNKTKIITIASIVALVILIVGATYAYFVAQTGEGAQTDIRINANTVDTLTFETGDPITLTLDQENFAEGKGNQTGSTFAKAMLTANNKTNSAIEHYYMYLNITGNTFTYSQNEDTPEILLTITDANNNEITSINGLTYKTVTDGNGTTLKGFDITTKTGLITILDNREITTTSSLTEQWNLVVTFVNYEFNQADNAGNSFNATLMIQKEKQQMTLADYVIAQYTGTQGENNIYYHDSTLTKGAGDNSYRYAGPSETVNNFVCFGSNENQCPTDNLYRIIGVIDNKIKLIKYDYMTLDELGTDGDYYETYKEMGITSSYKGTYGDGEKIGVYYWNNQEQSNTWSTSLLNKTNLNTNFINNIGTDWANKIALTTWKVGGNTSEKITSVNVTKAYQNEIINPDATNSTDNATEYQAKVGLMYISDYGYAASPNAWTLTMDSYSNATAKNNNWMYMGLEEWTISRSVGDSEDAFNVASDGSVNALIVLEYYNAVRVVFNLESSVTYVSGDGTKSLPIRIS